MPKPIQTSSATFRKIREEGFVYVDKTRYLYELIRYSTGSYFLARPRRFGKSLLISTLSEIFQGNRQLFEGLWIEQSDYTWQPYPIIQIDFSRHSIQNRSELEESIHLHLQRVATAHGLVLPEKPFYVQLEQLILQLSRQGPVVILIDEYDKPILDNIEQIGVARLIHERLKDFYAVLKSMEQHLRFVFVTGVSKFSRVGIFSDMNNLNDISMNPHYGALLGMRI